MQKVVYLQDLEYQAVLEDRLKYEYDHFNAIFDALSQQQQAITLDLVENSKDNRLLAIQLNEISFQLAEALDTIRELQKQLEESKNRGRHRENE